MIVTFYSYKGGVGRSMALASVATFFARTGLRVVMLDCDLEAPGLENYFLDGDQVGASQSRLGFVDLVDSFEKAIAAGVDSLSAEERASFESLSPYERVGWLMRLSDNRGPTSSETESGRGPLGRFLQRLSLPGCDDGVLWLLSAGNRSDLDAYQRRVRAQSWTALCANHAGTAFIDWLRTELRSIADVVLVDSRTGLSEISGVCTHQLCDALILFSAPNRPGMEGCLQVAEGVMKYSLGSALIEGPLRYGYGLWRPRIAMLPTRIPYEGELSVNAMDEVKRGVLKFADLLNELRRDWPSDWIRDEGPLWDLDGLRVHQVSRLLVGVPNVARKFINDGRNVDTTESQAAAAFHCLAGFILKESEVLEGLFQEGVSSEATQPSDTQGARVRILYSSDAEDDATLLAFVLRHYGDIFHGTDRDGSARPLIHSVETACWSDKASALRENGPVRSEYRVVEVRIISDSYLLQDAYFDPLVLARPAVGESDLSPRSLCVRISGVIRELGLHSSSADANLRSRLPRGLGRRVFVAARAGDVPVLIPGDPRMLLDSSLNLQSGVVEVANQVLQVCFDARERSFQRTGRMLGGAASVAGVPKPMDTSTWSEARLARELNIIMVGDLGWMETTGSARKWWNAFRSENLTRLALVYRLAEELKWRRATITEFFLAYVYSNTDNIQANLHYLDYSRLKKEEEKKKREKKAAESKGADQGGASPS